VVEHWQHIAGGLYRRGRRGELWVFRWRDNDGRERRCGLGPVAVVSDEDALRLAAYCDQLVRRGFNPSTIRREALAQTMLNWDTQ